MRPVLIVSYEMASKYIETIRKAEVGLLICDEAHRLKNSKGNKTINALKLISTRRRVLLTGTPVQNKLEEFFAMADFCNPSILQDLTTLSESTRHPLSMEGINVQTARQNVGGGTLKSACKIYRSLRTSTNCRSLEKFLPPKTNITVFCSLSNLQHDLYTHITKSQKVRRYSSEVSSARCPLPKALW